MADSRWQMAKTIRHTLFAIRDLLSWVRRPRRVPLRRNDGVEGDVL